MEAADSSQKRVERPVAIDKARELAAHEFRFGKLSSAPTRAALQVIRSEPDIWEKVEPRLGQEQNLAQRTAFPGESHRIGVALFANIFRNPEAAALYDVAIFDATEREGSYFRKKIDAGMDYTPLTIVGAGGVYGTIFSAAALKENPDSPPFGFDGGKRRGGIWAKSGDVTLDKSWWRMNSRSRPEDRSKLPIPGSEGNLNSLGAETQNLQVPDISSAQYPANNELGRVLSHDNFMSSNVVTNAELVKARVNRDNGKRGKYVQEYQDAKIGKRFFVYTDKIVQATGLGKEDLGFSRQFSSTMEALEQVEKDLEEGVVTPLLLTFFQLVEATTSNRESIGPDFKSFGLLGKGDTSKVIIENFTGVGGIDPGLPAQEGFVKEIVAFGLPDKTREEFAASERARYGLGFLEARRSNGGFFRLNPIDGRVVGIGIPKDKKGLVVYYSRTDETPEGPVKTIGTKIVSRLVTAAGFIDESNRIYSGLTAQAIEGKQEIAKRFDELFAKPGGTIYYNQQSNILRMDIDEVFMGGQLIDVTLVDKDNNVKKKRLDRREVGNDSILLDVNSVVKLELAGDAPKFEPVIDPDFDSEIPVAEKAQGFDVYKVGACTSYPLTKKELDRISAYGKIPENTKSVFRFVRPVVAFANKIAQATSRVDGALNSEADQEVALELSPFEGSGERQGLITVPVEAKNAVRKLSSNLRTDALLKYLALSRLTCIFPEGLEKLSFGVRKVESQDTNSPFSFVIEINPPIPNSEDWTGVIGSFLFDSLLQRTLLRLTVNASGAAEFEIGIKRGMVDIGNINKRSIKGSEEKEFYSKYMKLK